MLVYGANATFFSFSLVLVLLLLLLFCSSSSSHLHVFGGFPISKIPKRKHSIQIVLSRYVRHVTRHATDRRWRQDTVAREAGEKLRQKKFTIFRMLFPPNVFQCIQQTHKNIVPRQALSQFSAWVKIVEFSLNFLRKFRSNEKRLFLSISQYAHDCTYTHSMCVLARAEGNLFYVRDNEGPSYTTHYTHISRALESWWAFIYKISVLTAFCLSFLSTAEPSRRNKRAYTTAANWLAVTKSQVHRFETHFTKRKNTLLGPI